MKSFSAFTEQLNEAASKTVTVREEGRNTDASTVDSAYRTKVVGWLSNKHNPASGWIICTLSDFDKKWVEESGAKLAGVFRSFSGTHGATNLIKINHKSGTFAFADNAHLEKTDELKFTKATKFRQLVIDDNPKAKAAFK